KTTSTVLGKRVDVTGIVGQAHACGNGGVLSSSRDLRGVAGRHAERDRVPANHVSGNRGLLVRILHHVTIDGIEEHRLRVTDRVWLNSVILKINENYQHGLGAERIGNWNRRRCRSAAR